MNNSRIKRILAFSALFIINYWIYGENFTISYDARYFNPLAQSFKWDMKPSKGNISDRQIQIQYILCNAEDEIIWQRTDKHKDSFFSIYLFITELSNKTSGPFIRLETVPPAQIVTMNELPSCRYSNRILFEGPSLIMGDFSQKIKILTAKLLQSDTISPADKSFSRVWIGGDRKRICNLNVSLYLIVTVLPANVTKTE